MFEVEPQRDIIEGPVRAPRTPSKPPAGRLNLDEIVRPRDWNFVQESAPLVFHRGSSSRRPGWVMLAWSLFATVVDLLIAFSMTCFFAFTMVFFLSRFSPISTTEISTFLRTNFQVGFGGCVAMVFVCYLLSFRVFAGCTVGEWTCGIRLGAPRHRISNDYSLRVIQRFFLVTLTGIVTLPIISILIGDDMAGRLCGLPLMLQR